MLYHRSRRGGNGGIVFVGFALYVLGGLGSLFAHVIKAAVNRQREFLADASAVQFTRNPLGISQALQIIGSYTRGDIAGSAVQTNVAEEYSHLFFGKAMSSLGGLFNTHPPLEKRIRRIDKRWGGHFLSPEPKQPVVENEVEHDYDNKEFESLGHVALLAAVLAPEHVHQQVETPYDAVALIYSLLLDEDPAIRRKQMVFIRGAGIDDLEQKVEKTSKPDSYLSMIRAAFPSLKLLTVPQYKVVKKALLLLMQADKHISLQEWLIFQLFRHTLEVSLGIVRPSKNKYSSIEPVQQSVVIVLSLLSQQGGHDSAQIQRAFGKGANALGLYTEAMLDEAECTEPMFFAAAQQLADCYPLLKVKILNAFRACVENDGKITSAELELLSGMAAIMDITLPSAD